jgi:hypothetical protein
LIAGDGFIPSKAELLLSCRSRAAADQTEHKDETGGIDEEVDGSVAKERQSDVGARKRGRNRLCGAQQPVHSPWLRPTSVTHQPAMTATNPSSDAHWHRRRKIGVSNSCPRHRSQPPSAASPNIRPAQPTMIRNAKKGTATGGRWSAAKSLRPLTSPSSEWVRMRLPNHGTSMANALRSSRSLGIANTVSGTPRAVSQRASMAASLAG